MVYIYIYIYIYKHILSPNVCIERSCESHHNFSTLQVQQGWTEAKDVLELLQGSHATEVHFDAFPRKALNSLVKAEMLGPTILEGVKGRHVKYVYNDKGH